MVGDLDFQHLLGTAIGQYDSFGLLWRKERKPGEPGWEIQESLRPFLLTSEMTDEWPGTYVAYGKELYCTYSLVPASLTILSKAKHLFSLFGEGSPEDLVFYKNAQVMFASISHEEEAWHAT